MSNSAAPWTGAHQVPLVIGFSRQEYWSGLSHPPPGRDALLPFPDPGIEPESLLSPALQTDSLPLSHQGSAQGNNCPQNQGGGTFPPFSAEELSYRQVKQLSNVTRLVRRATLGRNVFFYHHPRLPGTLHSVTCFPSLFFWNTGIEIGEYICHTALKILPSESN